MNVTFLSTQSPISLAPPHQLVIWLAAISSHCRTPSYLQKTRPGNNCECYLFINSKPPPSSFPSPSTCKIASNHIVTPSSSFIPIKDKTRKVSMNITFYHIQAPSPRIPPLSTGSWRKRNEESELRVICNTCNGYFSFNFRWMSNTINVYIFSRYQTRAFIYTKLYYVLVYVYCLYNV